jgi:hypothetical protein
VKYELNFYVFFTSTSYCPGLNSLSDISLCRCVLDEQSAGGRNKNWACLIMESGLQFFKISSLFLLTCGYSYIIAVTDCTRKEAEEDSCAHAVNVGSG